MIFTSSVGTGQGSVWSCTENSTKSWLPGDVDGKDAFQDMSAFSLRVNT